MKKWLMTLAGIVILFSSHAFNEKDLIGKWVESDHTLLFGFDEAAITLEGKKSKPKLTMEFTESRMFYKTQNIMGSVFFVHADSTVELFEGVGKIGGQKAYKVIRVLSGELVIEEYYKEEDKNRVILYRYVMKRYIGVESINDLYAGDEKPVPVFSFVDEMPQYNGGETAKADFISKNLKGISPQRLFFNITIDTLGNVCNVKYTKKIDYADAVLVTNMLRKMPAWKPGRHKGKLVYVLTSINILIR